MNTLRNDVRWRQDFQREVGLLIAQCRRKRDFTQETIAIAVGIPRATFASIEGGRQRVSVDVLWRIAVVLGCSVNALTPESVDPSSASSPEAPQ